MTMLFSFIGQADTDTSYERGICLRKRSNGCDFIMFVVCHHDVNNANDKPKPAGSLFHGQKAAYWSARDNHSR